MFQKLKAKFLSMNLIVNYKKILPYVKPYWGRALTAILITIPIGSMDAVIAWALKPYMDVVMVEKSTGGSSTLLIPLLIILFSSLQSILTYSATYLNTWVGQKIAMDVKKTLFAKLMRYNASFFDQNTSGDVIFRFNNDVDSACSGLLNNMKLFTTRLFSSLSLIAVLFYNSWQLAIVATVILLGALYPLTRVRKRIKGLMDKSVFSGSAVMTHFNETYNGNRIISSYNLYDYQNKRFCNTLDTVFKIGMKMVQRTGMMSPLMHFIVSFGIAAVIWLGSYLIVTEQLTAGSFVSFIAALVMLYTPIKSIGNNFNSVQMALMAMERVFTALERVPDIKNCQNPKILEKPKKGIEYKNVSFSSTTVLVDVSVSTICILTVLVSRVATNANSVATPSV
jgi:subfamily B ATP-binding cassette protein MsbA